MTDPNREKDGLSERDLAELDKRHALRQKAMSEKEEAEALLDEADIYLSEDIDYLNSPFCERVRAYLSRTRRQG